MFPQCQLVWKDGDFTQCFRQVYLLGIIPVIICGVSLLLAVGQFVQLQIKNGRHGDGYTAISQSENSLGIPTQHYHDEVDDDSEAQEASPIPDVCVKVSKPKWQLLRIFIELITALGALATNVLLYMSTHEIGQLVLWSYVLLIVISRTMMLKHSNQQVQLWFHTAVLYFLILVIGALHLRSTILHPPEQSEVQKLNIVNFVLIVLLNLITLTTRVGNKTVELEYENDLESSREPLASLLSRLTFAWADPIVWKGYKKTCEIDDVWNLAPTDKAARVLSAYREEKKSRKLWLHYLHHLRTRLFIQALWGFLTSIFMFFPTLLLKAIVEYVEQPGDTPASAAWFWVALLLVCSCLQSIGDSQALWMGRKMSINLNAIAIGEIFAKALRRKASAGANLDSDSEKSKDEDKTKVVDGISPVEEASAEDQIKPETTKAPSDSQANSGTIFNLMASDSSRIGETMSYLHWLWGSIPTQLVLSVILLYRTLGISAFAGIVPMLIVFPIGLFISSKFFAIQKKIMAATDMRIETTNEVMINIRIIKYFAWEHRFKSKIEETRKKELDHLRNMFMMYLVNSLVFSSIPFLINLAAFLSYTLLEGKPLLPSVAFTAISLFQLLNSPLQMLGMLIMYVANFKVSADRVEKFMDEEETEKYDQLGGSNIDENGQRAVGFDNATFIWGGKDYVAEDGSQAFKMIDLDIRFSLDRLNVVAGPTGSGKTSLLMALLGEMTKISGKVYLPGGYDRATLKPDSTTGLTESVAYCAQQAWLLNGSVKENILFSSPFDGKRYEEVLRACALRPDIKIWSDGDETLVGEKGITLSGGQKQRISLARALYSNCRYVLLDDCLSAVDSHTGRWIFDKCIQGPLMAKRTCILVTHNVALCVPNASHVVVLENGTVAFQGSPEDAIDSGHLGDNVLSTPAPKATNESEPHENEADGPAANMDVEKKADPRVEKKAEGRVTWAVFSLYLSAMGKWYFWVIWAIMFVLEQIAEVLPNVWVREWSNQYVSPAFFIANMKHYLSFDYLRLLVPPPFSFGLGSVTAGTNETLSSISASHPVNVRYYVTVYALIGLIYVFINLLVGAVMFIGSLTASYSLHTRLLTAVTRAKFKFFDSTPLGQILNRFSKDIKTVDQELATIAIMLISRIGAIVVIIVLISAVTPQFLVPAAILSVVYYYVAKFYLAASTDLKRIDSVQKSPIYQQFGETLAGITTIRAYGDEKRFILDNHKRINTANRPYIFLWALNRWLSIRLDFTGAFISFSAAAFIVYNADTVDPGAAGLSLGYALGFTQNVLMCVRFYGMNEQNMNSVERIKEYLEIEPEAEPEIEATQPPANWPHEGSIEFVNYTTSYRPDLPPVLNKINFTIKGGQKVAIVGRTGAGKSTMALALFRALEATEGKIVIDGIDIGSIGLNDLRNSLTMVPQDPTLFSGTLRSNLDPFNLYTDEEIYTALRNVHLIGNPGDSSTVSGTATPIPGSTQEGTSDSSSSTLLPLNTKINKNIFTNLSHPIQSHGSNLSGGQKQLLCLVRAMLKKTQILIMDEATASIDYATDKKIQETIGGLRDCTIVTIAHRLMSIVDYDAVVVLDKGEVVEWGGVWELLNGDKGEGVFRGMCEESGDWDGLKKKAKEAWKAKGGN